MANNLYLKAIRRLWEGQFDFRSGSGQVFKVLLVKTGSSAGTDLLTAEFVGDIGTLNEYDGSSYVRKTLSITSPALDVPNSRVEIPIADVAWTTLGAATGGALGIGAVVYREITSDALSPVVGFFDSLGFPMTGSGTTFTLQFNAEGGLVGKFGTL